MPSRPGKPVKKAGLANIALKGYLALPVPLRRTIPDDFRNWVRERLMPTPGWIPRPRGKKKPGKAKPAAAAKLKAQQIEELLWSGYSRVALPRLEALAFSRRQSKAERAEAAWAIARWHGAHGDAARAHEYLVAMRAIDPGKIKFTRFLLLEARSLRELGRIDEARTLVADALAGRPNGDPDLFLVAANCVPDPGAHDRDTDARRLEWVNRVYNDTGVAPLSLNDPEGAFTIDNLAADAPPVTEADLGRPLPKVSVLVPTYAATQTLPFALRGLLAQTWTNLEIIVVDDCSPDDTVAVAEAIAATDPRVKVLRQPANQGSYAARNAGLRAATGDYITTHDADDWSHPQKIELQVRHFLDKPSARATTSYWIRCDHDMFFRGLFRPWARLISKNISSLMFPREVMEELGGWVEARAGADTELLRRLETLYGSRAREGVAFGGPLAFSLHEERSLTRQSVTHVRTVYHGVRKELQDAADHWRRTAVTAGELTVNPLADPRPFPIPMSLLPDRAEAIDCEVLFIGDLAMDGGAFESTFNYITAAAADRKVAVFHWRRHDLSTTKPINDRVRDLAQAGRVHIVAPGERVRARTVIVGYPVILRELPDLLPEIELQELIVVVNQMASRLLGGGDPQYDPEVLRANARQAFGTEGIWVPISGLVQRLMREDPRYSAPASTIWTPLIDTATWCSTPPRWRGGPGTVPVIGRHARDHYTKWPEDSVALAAAYCVDRPARVEILGGADRAFAVLGRRPQNWTVTRFGRQEPLAFLHGLDAFVHYPHADYIEEFGRAVLEALAVGLPAVLPPVFRDTFGPAALYAEPDEVWPTISKLWASEADWLAQGAAAQAFVRAGSDWSVFPARLAATLAEAAERQRTLGTGIGAETGAKAESEGGPRETGAAAADAVAVHA